MPHKQLLSLIKQGKLVPSMHGDAKQIAQTNAEIIYAVMKASEINSGETSMHRWTEKNHELIVTSVIGWLFSAIILAGALWALSQLAGG